MNLKAFFTGVVVGSAIIASATLLTTPTSGKELRQKGKAQLDSVRNYAKQFSEDSKDVVNQLKKTTEVSKEAIKDLSVDMKDTINDWKQEVEPTIEQLKNDIDQLKNNIEQAKQTFS